MHAVVDLATRINVCEPYRKLEFYMMLTNIAYANQVATDPEERQQLAAETLEQRTRRLERIIAYRKR